MEKKELTTSKKVKKNNKYKSYIIMYVFNADVKDIMVFLHHVMFQK
jgi:uncharacterized protein YlbG (UPF0298 family)